MYKIGELSRLCGLTVKTLRYYSSIGLLSPDEIDPFTGYRYYSAARLADCYRITALKELGFSLGEIRRHMSASSKNEVIALLDAKRAELKALMSVTKSQLKRLDLIKQIMTEGDSKMFDIIIENPKENSDNIRTAYTREIFKNKEDAYSKADKMKNDLPKSLILGRLIIVNYETEYREEDFDLAACVEIGGDLPTDCCYEDKTVDFLGTIASLVCRREELDAAYRAMWTGLDEKNMQITGAFYEFYHDDGTVELKVPVCALTEEETVGDDTVSLLPFENDEEVIGKWEYLDRFPSGEQFNINSPKDSRKYHVHLKELYFLSKGEGYWIIEGWTKGCFAIRFGYPSRRYCNRYSIREINGEKLLFVEMKDDPYKISRGGKPEIYVYRKVSDRVYTKADIMVRDKVDFPYLSDEGAIGRWHSCDFVPDIERFDPITPFRGDEELFVSEIELFPEGKAVYKFRNNNTRSIEYTKGKLLDKCRNICEEYEQRVINGKEYLFTQWKSGDYVFGGEKPGYYVFIKV